MTANIHNSIISKTLPTFLGVILSRNSTRKQMLQIFKHNIALFKKEKKRNPIASGV